MNNVTGRNRDRRQPSHQRTVTEENIDRAVFDVEGIVVSSGHQQMVLRTDQYEPKYNDSGVTRPGINALWKKTKNRGG